jgi:methyl-accepting chemotaxis protein
MRSAHTFENSTPMSTTEKNPRRWQARDIDRAMLVIVGLNVLGALLLGQQHGQLALAAWAATGLGGVALAGVLLASGTLTSSLAAALSLMTLVALQIHLSGGVLLHHFNVFVSLSVLLVYRDWRPIALAATAFAVHHLAFDRMLQAGLGTYCLSVPDLPQILMHVAFVAVQALILCWIAGIQQGAAREARELEFLVNAMGREGKIRLNLDVIRAETQAGQRLQHVQHRMAAALREMHVASQHIDGAAQQVAEGSGELMTRTEEAAHGLKESAMCLEQISVIVQHSTEASNEAKAMSSTAAGMADQGGRLVSDVVRTMQEIDASARRINDIIAVIDGIAFQTNILALNAAVEAARAGEQGRGFAVVAGEVRSLAHRSAAAAKEIKGLIGASTNTVEAGTRLVGGAGETMNQLVESVRRVGQLFEAVTADTSEQMQGLRTVAESISELGHTTQHNVAVAERASASAAELREQSTRLADVLSAFNLGPALSAVAPPKGPSQTAAAPQRASASSTGAGTGAATSGSHRPAPAARAAAQTADAGSGVVEFF